MEYQPMKLQSRLYGLGVKKPIGQGSTAIIENLSESYELKNLKPILYELKKLGVKNYVFDLSQYPASTRRPLLAFLDGAVAMGSGFKSKYFGVTVDEAAAGDPSFRKYIAPKIAESLDSAVDSFLQ